MLQTFENFYSFHSFLKALSGKNSEKSAPKCLARPKPPPLGHFAQVKNTLKGIQLSKNLQKCSKSFGNTFTPPPFGILPKYKAPKKSAPKHLGKG